MHGQREEKEEKQQQSCGKSVMCRDGITQLQQIVEDQVRGRGQSDDFELLCDLCKVIAETDGCELSSKAASNILHSLERDYDSWSQHCLRKRCSELVCKANYSVYIDPELCNGCGICLQIEPKGAIDGDSGLIHVVRDDSGLKTETAFAACPHGAIKKAGAVKPRVPENPVR
jgi:NADH-quinone oxidoreductase subunit F